ncbi:adenylate cyclase type 10-like [Dysidea avara]|uniref:adenylate cyclase type 10-like n=1 Tax=Dysidea avara TaxID=196820 RepID=UPI00331D4CF0
MYIATEEDPEAIYRDVLFNNRNAHITHTNIPIVYDQPDTFWELIGKPVVKQYEPVYEQPRSYEDVLWPAPTLPAVTIPQLEPATSLHTTTLHYHHNLNEDDDISSADASVFSLHSDREEWEVVPQLPQPVSNITDMAVLDQVSSCSVEVAPATGKNLLSVFFKIMYRVFRHQVCVSVPFKTKKSSVGIRDTTQSLHHLTEDYHSQHMNSHALMTALEQLNEAENDGDTNEVIEAYAAVTKCCSKLSHCKKLGEHCIKQANKQSSKLSLTTEDLSSYVQLLTATSSFKLNNGDLEAASQSGEMALSTAANLEDYQLLLLAIPQHLEVQLMMFNIEAVKGTLENFKEIVTVMEDTKLTALYHCYELDVLLETGIKHDEMDRLISFIEDYEFNSDNENFFLTASIATWYCRNEEWGPAERSLKIAQDCMPSKFDTLLAAKGLCRYIESYLIMLSHNPNNKDVKKNIKQIVGKLKKVIKKFPVLKPRSKHLEAYHLMIQKKTSTAKRKLNSAIKSAQGAHNYLELYWTERNS